MATYTHWVYTCDGTKGEAVAPLMTAVYPTCSPASSGNWTQITLHDEQPQEVQMADLISLGSAFGVCLMFGLGFVAGRQR